LITVLVLVGPTGLTGPQGQPGPQGVQGITGVAGPTGSAGLIGPVGMSNYASFKFLFNSLLADNQLESKSGL
jgi:Collagen triple helix repeat (20 copies)